MSSQQRYDDSNKYSSEEQTPSSSLLGVKSSVRQKAPKESWKDCLLPEVAEKFLEIRRQNSKKVQYSKLTSRYGFVPERLVSVRPSTIRMDILESQNSCLREQLGYLRSTLLKLLQEQARERNHHEDKHRQ